MLNTKVGLFKIVLDSYNSIEARGGPVAVEKVWTEGCEQKPFS